MGEIDPSYNRWQQRDDCYFNWIINNIDASLVNEVSQYETAYDLWDSLATTYGSGADQFQISDLHRQAYSIKQGDSSLENLLQKLQDLWISIDTRDPNPMDTPSSIEKYNQNTQRHILYQFMWALDDHRYRKIKREILNMDLIPTARKAYGLVRRESVNEKLLNPETKESGIGAETVKAEEAGEPQQPSLTTAPPTPKIQRAAAAVAASSTVAAEKPEPRKCPKLDPEHIPERVPPSGLSHVDGKGEARLVDISSKEITKRVALASCKVVLGQKVFDLVSANQMEKGDVLGVAKIAGVCAAKQTSNLIPLCHSINLSRVHVDLDLNPRNFSIEVRGEAVSTGRTGVEMEALTAVTVAGLTVYDMCKVASKDIVITDVRLEQKSGGKSGDWSR
ncbi:hypothetical protein SASPL_100725 [Salvia splendens]|uniref:cyclic pyranopterin monophosphate synthase n=1 Tax=Salvia splendens TaxID=180675 RepID=A0A8X8YNT0_SALSN|nr:hypothetical protein SASPL_100725 [Salvia splendens]